MQLPKYDLVDYRLPKEVTYALGIKKYKEIKYCNKISIVLIEIDSHENLASLKPDYPRLLDSYQKIKGICVTVASRDTQFDFHYQYFWSWSGTDEDPVTGAVQTFLTPFWAEKIGKTGMKAFQSSQRTGEMEVFFEDDKTFIHGQVVTTLEGCFGI